MDQILLRNFKNAKWVWISFFGGMWLAQGFVFMPHLINTEVFGHDGNGG